MNVFLKTRFMKWIPNARRNSKWLILLTLLCTSCSLSESKFDQSVPTLKVTVTTGMIADLVRQIGQEHVEVLGLMGPGVDPHLYKASFGDIKKIDQAQVIFYNGLQLEGKMQEIFIKVGKFKPVVAISKDISVSQLRLQLGKSDEYDPHIWFNVQLWMQAATTVRDTLIQLDPNHRTDYELNARTYLGELSDLDRYAREQINQLPERSKILITSHDAFGYFGDAYHIQVKALQGMSTASEYGTKDVIELREFIIKNQIKTVFVETSISKKSIQAVIEGARTKGQEVQIGGNLYSDALGPIGSQESEYIGMFKYNLELIINGLR
jgi:manganese/zinc/iron transport system substrate-binding protein